MTGDGRAPASIAREADLLLLLSAQVAAAQDARGGRKDASDQNFDYMFKLLIIGNSSVGKTSFLFRYADDSFTSAFVSTVGIDFKVKTVFKHEKRIKLQIWVSDWKCERLGLGRPARGREAPVRVPRCPPRCRPFAVGQSVSGTVAEASFRFGKDTPVVRGCFWGVSGRENVNGAGWWKGPPREVWLCPHGPVTSSTSEPFCTTFLVHRTGTVGPTLGAPASSPFWAL